MKKEDLLKAFTELSPEDQQAMRAEILAKGASKKTGQACCTDAMKEHLHGMMEKMHASENPMAMCEEMMRMCQEKMKKEQCCQ